MRSSPVLLAVPLASLLLTAPVRADVEPTVLARWGSLGTEPGQFEVPQAVAVDTQGDVYVVDKYGVQKFTESGEFLYRIPTGAPFRAKGVAVDSEGIIYVTEEWYMGSGVRAFNQEGQVLRSWGVPSPKGVATDSYGNVFVVSGDNIEKYRPDGMLRKRWTSGSLVYGVVVDPAGLVYTGCQGRVFQYTAAGVYQGWARYENYVGYFGEGYGIAVDGEGFVYVTDSRGYIRVFDGEGNYRTRWKVGWGSTGIALDDAGTIYVTSQNTHEVVKYARLVSIPPPPPTILPQEPAVLLHIGEVSPRHACQNVPRSSAEIVTTAEARPDGSASYYVYLLAAPHIDYFVTGLAGVQTGIDYDASTETGQGIQIHGWSPCADLQFPMDTWPVPGSGNTLTWDFGNNCQVNPIFPVGYFYLSVYSPSTMSLVPFPPTGKVKIADCQAAEEQVPVAEARLGWVSLGGAARGLDTDGCNPLLEPCDGSVPVRPATWGSIKARYGAP